MRSCTACGETFSTISELCFHQIETHGRLYDEEDEEEQDELIPAKKKKFTEDFVFFGNENKLDKIDKQETVLIKETSSSNNNNNKETRQEVQENSDTVKLYSCKLCNPKKIYKNKESYKKHKNSHKHFHVLAVSKNKKCPICDSDSLKDVKCKCQHKHCIVCKYQLKAQKNLESSSKQNSNKTSTATNSYYCPLCSSNYSSNNEFIRHKQSHKHKHLLALQQNSKCSICKKTSLLEIKCHCDDVLCPVCNFRKNPTVPYEAPEIKSAVLETLKSTERQNSQGYQFECEICHPGYYFMNRDKYTRHLKSHKHMHRKANLTGEACMECHKTDIYACKCPIKGCLACKAYNTEMNRQLGIEEMDKDSSEDGTGGFLYKEQKYTCAYCFPAGHRWSIAAIKKGCVNKHLADHKHKHLFAIANGEVCKECGTEDADLFKVGNNYKRSK